MSVDSLSLLLKSSWGTWVLGTANLVAPLLGYCVQFDGSTTCPANPSTAEIAAWMLVTVYLYASSLATQHLEWHGVQV